MEILLYALLLLTAAAIALQFIFRPRKTDGHEALAARMDAFDAALQRIEKNLKDDFARNREESTRLTRENREELSSTVINFKKEIADALRALTDGNAKALQTLSRTLDEKVAALTEKTEQNAKVSREELTNNIRQFSEATTQQLEKINKQVEEKLTVLADGAKSDSALMREALVKAFSEFRQGFKEFQDSFEKNVKSFNDVQREKFAALEKEQGKLVESTEKRLDQMRETVEEKLSKTLNDRLNQSFETVGKQLEAVQQGLGEMKTLATDVGGLKKVLSNVKQRGGLGEIQLEMLLENVLAPEQYEKNVKTKQGSDALVEFAIKLPGRDEGQSVMYLPIDAKFPMDAYAQWVDAYESSDKAASDAAGRNLENVVKKMAGDIRDKYLDPPHTTDFGLMYLPFEGLYAEVARRPALMEELQRKYRVTVTGPTTLAAILNSLQMGFRTLALQKRSSEVWNVLGKVKAEFEKFGGLLETAHKQITKAGETIEALKGTRTRAITRSLREVEAMPAVAEAAVIMAGPIEEELEGGEDEE